MSRNAPQMRMLLIVTIVSLVRCEPAGAIPAFARKYNTSCNTCHSPIPRLTPTGVEFENDGFRLKNVLPVDSLRDTGDERLMLLKEIPLSFRFDGFVQYQPRNSPEADFQWPFLMKIISGGEITGSISYYLYFIFNEEGNIGGVEDAFIRFSNIAGLGIDLTAGQFQVIDPVVERELRPTFEDYAIYTVRPGDSKADLTYDRGLTLGYTLPTETELGIAVLNGNGIGGSDSRGNFDSDPYKNFFLRIAQGFSETAKIGALGYAGKEREVGAINRILMVGPDLSLSLGNYSLISGYLYRNDKNPFFDAGTPVNVNSRGGFVQLGYRPTLEMSDWYIFVVYNGVSSDIGDLDYRSIVGNFTYLLARNFKIMAEYGYDIQRERHRLTIGFVTAM